MININKKLGKLAAKVYRHHSLPNHINAPPGCYFYPKVDDLDNDYYIGVSCRMDYWLTERGIANYID